MRKCLQLATFLTAISLTLVVSVAAIGQIKVVGTQCRALYDGTFEMYYLVQSGPDGPVKEMSLSDLQRIAPTAWQKLVVTQDIRWEGVTKVKWGKSPLAAAHKAEFNKVFKKLINKKRGSPKRPKMVIGSEVVQIPFTDPRTVQDNKNIIYMTQDDRYFVGKSSTAAYMNTWFGAEGGIPLKDGKFTSPRKILETDGFFRSNHFSSTPGAPGVKVDASFSSDVVTVHEFGHAFGFQHTPYTNDYMSYRRQQVSAKTLKRKNSSVWKLSTERDKLYYDDAYQANTRMLPTDGTVLDITYLHAPGKNDQGLNTNAYHPMVVTSLKGFSGKQLAMSVYKGVVNPVQPPANALFTIKGDSIDYFIRMEQGYPFVRKYRLSLLNLGKEKYWKKLSKLITTSGKQEDRFGEGVVREIVLSIDRE